MEKIYKHFGVMIDCSNHAVKSVEELKRFISNLAKMGYNTVELYTEETYRIPSEPYFGYLRGGYTGNEIKELDEFCKTKGVELIPCIQTLAHLSHLVKLPCYRDIHDIDDIILIDEPKTYVLIEKMFAFCADNFTSREINIGFDEAHMVGLGKYLEKHGFQDRYEIVLRHLNKVIEIAKKYGFKPHMWSDMFFRLFYRLTQSDDERVEDKYYSDRVIDFPKEVIDNIPEDVAVVFWDYYHDKKNMYDAMFKSHKNLNREVWFAGGAWTWFGIVPFNDLSLRTTKPAMQSAFENNIDNVLITLWGDNGGECSYNSVLPSLFASRMFADGIYDMSIIKNKFFDLFGLNFDDFMVLDEINNTEKNKNTCRTENPAKTLFYNDCFLGIMDVDLENAGKLDFKTCAKNLKKASRSSGEFFYIFDTLYSLAKFLDVKAYLGIETRKAYQEKNMEQIKELIKKYEIALRRLNVFYSKFKDLWLKENKPFGWEVQDIRIGGVIQRMKFCKHRLSDYVNGTIDSIPELEEKLLPYYNTLAKLQYTGVATTCII